VAKVLVTYASKHGSTQEIAEFIARTLTELGQDVDCLPVDSAPDPGRYEAVVLGSAVYIGSWLNEASAFARGNADRLASLPVWLFSSGPMGTELDDEEEQPKELEELRNRIRPRDHRVFFGALDPEKLGFGERMVVKAVRAPTGDFRNWEDIRDWSGGIATSLG
jgi:menaquinone-dependent protoporphyrinogen oxidase